MVIDNSFANWRYQNRWKRLIDAIPTSVTVKEASTSFYNDWNEVGTAINHSGSDNWPFSILQFALMTTTKNDQHQVPVVVSATLSPSEKNNNDIQWISVASDNTLVIIFVTMVLYGIMDFEMSGWQNTYIPPFLNDATQNQDHHDE
jgi:hypothetical protein